MTDHGWCSIGVRGATLTALLMVSGAAYSQAAAQTMVGVQDLSWSADGLKLFFSAMRVKPDYSDYTPEKWAVYRYDLMNGAVTRVSASSFSVAASPEEQLIIVGKLVDGNRDLYVLDQDGREVERLTTDSAEDFGAAWSPDGKAIAFTTKRGGHSEVYVANRDGSNAHRLIDTGPDRTLNPAWSPDGRNIACYREKGDGKDQVLVIRADGSFYVNVTDDGFNNVYPGWTPDGRVVYGQTSRESESVAAFTVALDGTEKRPLPGIQSFFTRYSPDGTRIAFLESAAGSNAVRVVIATRDGERLATVPLDGVM